MNMNMLRVSASAYTCSCASASERRTVCALSLLGIHFCCGGHTRWGLLQQGSCSGSRCISRSSGREGGGGGGGEVLGLCREFAQATKRVIKEASHGERGGDGSSLGACMRCCPGLFGSKSQPQAGTKDYVSR